MSASFDCSGATRARERRAARLAELVERARERDQAQEQSKGEPCWLCSTPMIARHCKLACPRCGFTRDCSDP